MTAIFDARLLSFPSVRIRLDNPWMGPLPSVPRVDLQCLSVTGFRDMMACFRDTFCRVVACNILFAVSLDLASIMVALLLPSKLATYLDYERRCERVVSFYQLCYGVCVWFPKEWWLGLVCKSYMSYLPVYTSPLAGSL